MQVDRRKANCKPTTPLELSSKIEEELIVLRPGAYTIK